MKKASVGNLVLTWNDFAVIVIIDDGLDFFLRHGSNPTYVQVFALIIPLSTHIRVGIWPF